MLVHQRNNEVFGAIDMDALQKEVAAVVRKYINVKPDKAPNMLGGLLEIVGLSLIVCSFQYFSQSRSTYGTLHHINTN